MSGKSEKTDASNSYGNLKVLQKAKSFRDDIKHRIIRRSPSNQREKSVTPSAGSIQGLRLAESNQKSSPKSRKKLNRGSSFKEESKTEKIAKHTDLEKLDIESKKVHHALLGLRVVVSKNMLHMLPGSATVVLETFMELSQFLGNFLLDQDSTSLLCAYKQVYLSLANLVKWSDEISLASPEEISVNQETSNEVIKAIEDGVKELLKLAIEKLEKKSVSSPYTTLQPKSPGILSNGSTKSDGKHRSSLPDIPLTPREKEILETTGEHLNYSNNNTAVQHTEHHDVNQTDENPPPPKPPLPANYKTAFIFDGILPPNANTSQTAVTAPPLPPKKRTPSASSLYDNHNNSTSAVDALWSDSGISGHDSNPSYNPSAILRSVSSSSSADNSNNMCRSSNSSTSSTDTLSDNVSNSQYPDFSPGEFYHQRQRLASDEATLRAESVSDSMVSSQQISSRVKGSSDSCTDDGTSSVQTVKTSTASGGAGNPDLARLSQYDNFEHPDGIESESSQEIQSLTDQINQLTVNVVKDPFVMDAENNKTQNRPPLPAKKNGPVTTIHVAKSTKKGMLLKEAFMQGHLMSKYDNFPADPFLQGNEAVNMASSSFFSSTHSSMSSMKTSHSAFEFSTSSSSSSSSASSVNFHHQVNHATSSFTKSEKMSVASSNSGGSGPKMRTSYERQKAYAMATGSVTMRNTVHGNMSLDDGLMMNPPPLPPKIKKKTVEEYMQMFGQYTSPNFTDLSRHSIQAVSYYKSQYNQHQMELFHPLTFSRSNTLSIMSDISSGRGSDVFSIQSASSDDTAPPTPPFPPKLPVSYDVDTQSESNSPELTGRNNGTLTRDNKEHPIKVHIIDVDKKPDSLKAIQSDKHPIAPSPSSPAVSPSLTSTSDSHDKDRDSFFSEASSTLDDADVNDLLVRKKQGDDDPDIRGGTVDALIVHATTAGRKEIMYQEAFLTTYRTFIKPKDLIDKLLYRYHKFSRMEDVKKKKLSRNAFSFLIRVIDELCTEIDNNILKVLMDLGYQLLSQGELMLGKILRRKVLEKVELKKQLQLDNTHHMTLWESHHMTTKQYSLLEFKPETVAEQMTLLDSELFLKIEIPEVLLWAKDQNEEQSPNLTKFTEHFNKLSFWCRTQVLQQEDPKDREKYLVKFIKIMKCLRKFNNFNSYLALLSALDSAPVRRLEWQKHNVEALKELCHLIDSTASFRNYRQALAETEPPCIPYIGIILQDLTFVHIGNPDYLEKVVDCINFSKRWQQFNILDNMKRFKKCDYDFKKNHKIIAFFNGFEDNLCEESLWQISESIKPRGGKKKPVDT